MRIPKEIDFDVNVFGNNFSLKRKKYKKSSSNRILLASVILFIVATIIGVKC